MATGAVDVVVAEGEGFVDFTGVVGGDRDSADVMDVEVFEGDELWKVVAFFANADGGVTSGDFEITDDEVLAAGEVEGVLFGVGSFDDDFCAFSPTNGDGFVGGATLCDLQASGSRVGAFGEDDFVTGLE